MDAKDLRTEPALSDRSNDGHTKYSQGSSVLQCNRNKQYQDIGPNNVAKVDVQTSRPCAVIGPDRVVPPSTNVDSYIKKGIVEQWPSSEATYRRPPEYPHKLPDYNHPNRNISPRQTFQENMQRIMVPPSYNAVKSKEDHHYSVDANAQLRNTKMNVSTDTKYCEVPYPINSIPNEQKISRNPDVSVPNMNPALVRSALHGWPPNNANVRPSKPYGAPELYQYSEYQSCTGPRPMVIPRSHRTHEDPSHVYPEAYYHEGGIRFKPYPTVKERYPQTRYEYLNNYSNPFQPSPAYPPQKYDLQKSVAPQPYPAYTQVPLKYLETRMSDPIINGYQRSVNQTFNSVPYRNQMVHPSYATIGSNCLQPNKYYSYPPDNSIKSMAPNKLPYEVNQKMYSGDFENRNLRNPMAESFYVNEMARAHPIKGQMLGSNYPSVNMHTIPPHPYYRRENPPIKNYELGPAFRNIDPSVGLSGSTLSRLPSQFSPNTISPSDSNTSNDTIQTQSQDDCGYVSQSSSASIRSFDSGFNRIMPHELYRGYGYRYGPIVKNSHLMSKSDVNNLASKNAKKDLNVRQFLQMWNEGEEEGSENTNKEITVITNSANDITNRYEASQEQLYVLGLVNVPSEELGKYEHIQKVSKLPENIKGYNSIELLNQFEEVIESSNMNNYNAKQLLPRDYHSSLKNSMSMQGMTVSSRPLSPLDVEAKISQSVIHKEVGCNFEIKPCSPKMLNVEVAAPIQTILGERAIEKVTNPLIMQSPIMHNVNDPSFNAVKPQDRKINLSGSPKVPSCKMVNTHYSNNSTVDSIKTNYSLQDLESNSGVCLASLPRLDNDIELNFPEVNQQFINANKVETVITTTSKELPALEMEQFDSSAIRIAKQTEKLTPNIELEKECSKLSKYRKLKRKGSEKKEIISESNARAMRTDSVIIKNPENMKMHEDSTDPYETVKTFSQDAQKDPINLTVNSELQSDQPESKSVMGDIFTDEREDIAIDFSLNSGDHLTDNRDNFSSNVLNENNQSEQTVKVICELPELPVDEGSSSINEIMATDKNIGSVLHKNRDTNSETSDSRAPTEICSMIVPCSSNELNSGKLLQETASNDLITNVKNLTEISHEHDFNGEVHSLSKKSKSIEINNINDHIPDMSDEEAHNQKRRESDNLKISTCRSPIYLPVTLEFNSKKILCDSDISNVNNNHENRNVSNDMNQGRNIEHESIVKFTDSKKNSHSATKDVSYDDARNKQKEFKTVFNQKLKLHKELFSPYLQNLLSNDEGRAHMTFDPMDIFNKNKQTVADNYNVNENNIDHNQLSPMKNNEIGKTSINDTYCKKTIDTDCKRTEVYVLDEIRKKNSNSIHTVKNNDIGSKDKDVHIIDKKKKVFDNLVIPKAWDKKLNDNCFKDISLDSLRIQKHMRKEGGNINELKQYSEQIDRSTEHVSSIPLIGDSLKEISYKDATRKEVLCIEMTSNITADKSELRDATDNIVTDENNTKNVTVTEDSSNLGKNMVVSETDHNFEKPLAVSTSTISEYNDDKYKDTQVIELISKPSDPGEVESDNYTHDNLPFNTTNNNSTVVLEKTNDHHLTAPEDKSIELSNDVTNITNPGTDKSLQNKNNISSTSQLNTSHQNDKINSFITLDKNSRQSPFSGKSKKLNRVRTETSKKVKKKAKKVIKNKRNIENQNIFDSLSINLKSDLAKHQKVDKILKSESKSKTIAQESVKLNNNISDVSNDKEMNRIEIDVESVVAGNVVNVDEIGEVKNQLTVKTENNIDQSIIISMPHETDSAVNSEVDNEPSTLVQSYKNCSINETNQNTICNTYVSPTEFGYYETSTIVDESARLVVELDATHSESVVNTETNEVLKVKEINTSINETNHENTENISSLKTNNFEKCEMVEEKSYTSLTETSVITCKNESVSDMDNKNADKCNNSDNKEIVYNEDSDIQKESDDNVSAFDMKNIEDVNNDDNSAACDVNEDIPVEVKLYDAHNIRNLTDVTTELSEDSDNSNEKLEQRYTSNDTSDIALPSFIDRDEKLEIVSPNKVKEWQSVSRRENNSMKMKKNTLKRSLSESALDMCTTNLYGNVKQNDSINCPYIWPNKRKRIMEPETANSQFITENFCNIIHHNIHNRRNSISSVYNEENVYILIDNNCIITSDCDDTEKICFTELPEDCLPCIHNDVDSEEENIENESDVMAIQEDINFEYSDSCVQDEDCLAEKTLEESWVEDVACVETVVSEDIAEDIIVSALSSPRDTDLTEAESNNEDTIFDINEYTDRVKYIYGDKMCSDDAHLVETLYRTPQMDVNKTLIYRESQGTEDSRYYDRESLEKVLSESNTSEIITKVNESAFETSFFTTPAENTFMSTPNYNESDDICNVTDYSPVISNINLLNILNKNDCDEEITEDPQRRVMVTQDGTIHSCESSVDNVFSFNDQESLQCINSSSPEVSSTTSEDKNSSILLKITNYGGSRISQVNDINLKESYNTVCCKYTEKKDYLNSLSNCPKRPLLTKAAQKYIPPLKETIGDLKVKLSLPEHSLLKLKQLKISKEKPKTSKNNKSRVNIYRKDIIMKPKPKFEDVLKSIDEIQFKMHKEKSKKAKKAIPKVVIKKNENGSHYASTTNNEKYNPDLTGRKWQPWVFLEKNKFIDKMALQRKTKAIFNHRKNSFVLAETFKKYKATTTSTNFIISQPKRNICSNGQLKYTIRFKHTY